MAHPPADDRDQGTEPDPGGPGPGGPGSSPCAGGAPGPEGPGVPVRGPRLAGFAKGGAWDGRPPSAALAAAAQEASGPGWQCPGGTEEELAGLVRGWAAVESWASAGKLGVIAEMARREIAAGAGSGWQGDVQGTGFESLYHELSLALAVSAGSAETAVWLARELRERLPGIGAMLAGGTLTQSKARTLADELSVLGDVDAAHAEALVIGRLAGKTHGQLGKMAAQAACTVDPESAQKRRRAAERDDARVRLWRQQSGAVAMAGYGLPSDEALAAFTNLGDRAAQYRESGAFPGAGMDQLRVMGYLDLLNGVTAADRIARAIARATADAGAGADARADANTDGDGDGDVRMPDDADADGDGSASDGLAHGGSGNGGSGRGGPANDDSGNDDSSMSGRGDDDPSDDDPSDDHGGGDLDDGGSCPGSGRPGGAGPSPEPAPGRLPSLRDLIIPLRTLLGLAGRPGEGHGLGPLDPGLALDLAAAAALSLRREWCVTVNHADGIAIGHGCARPGRPGRHEPPGTPALSGAAYPARVNLTIPASALPGLSAPRGSPGRYARSGGPWAFTPRDDPGPPGGFGTWTLALPGGRELTVRPGPVPVFECDHRNESHAYKPNGTLRHLVQVRDGECTFPSCSRHARESDFEHAIPYDQGGRTCACNAGARSRGCHRVKQSPGWKLTQPRPGWHQWTTPSGRTYTQGPKQYPV